MLLAVDIGNTNITFGLFAGDVLKKQFDIPTQKYKKEILAGKIKNIGQITSGVICSVVPRLTKIIPGHLRQLTAAAVYIIGKDLKVPLKNNYRKPKEAGQDRLVNSYAASYFYHYPVIIIDSGSAITLDAVSKNKAYLGGVIIPGLAMSLNALYEKTALLPRVKLRPPKKLIGGDTQNSILSGVVLGSAVLIQELSARISKHLGKATQVIGTGGSIYLLKKYFKGKIIIDQNLTLKGINLIYGNKIKSRS